MAEEGQQLPYVNEIVLKKRKNNEDWALKRKLRLENIQQSKVNASKPIIRRPEDFVKEYREKELDFVRTKLRMRIRKLSEDSVKSNLLFVIRIAGSKDMHPTTKKTLRMLRLRQKFTGVFLKANEQNLKKILSVEPFITYGYPSLKSVRELIHKRGVGNIEKEKIPLTNNNVIEEMFGKYGIVCLEDLVNEIYSIGPHFKDVTRFLFPFQLKKPNSIYPYKKKHFNNGGDSGNREDKINEFIDKMN